MALAFEVRDPGPGPSRASPARIAGAAGAGPLGAALSCGGCRLLWAAVGCWGLPGAAGGSCGLPCFACLDLRTGRPGRALPCFARYDPGQAPDRCPPDHSKHNAKCLLVGRRLSRALFPSTETISGAPACRGAPFCSHSAFDFGRTLSCFARQHLRAGRCASRPTRRALHSGFALAPGSDVGC